MNPGKKAARQKAMEHAADYVIGFALLTKGWEKAEHFSAHPLRTLFILLAGALVIAGAAARGRLEKRIPSFHSLFHLAEGAVLVVSASIFLQKGKHWIPAITCFIGLVYIAIGIVQLRATGPDQKKALRTLGKILGIVFIAAAVVMTTVALIFDPKLPVFIVAGILFLAGLFNLVFVPRRLRRRTEPKS